MEINDKIRGLGASLLDKNSPDTYLVDGSHGSGCGNEVRNPRAFPELNPTRPPCSQPTLWTQLFLPTKIRQYSWIIAIFERETVLCATGWNISSLYLLIHLKLGLLCHIAIETIINLFTSLRMIERSVNNELGRMPLNFRHYHRIFSEELRKTLKSLVRKAGVGPRLDVRTSQIWSAWLLRLVKYYWTKRNVCIVSAQDDSLRLVCLTLQPRRSILSVVGIMWIDVKGVTVATYWI
jgi:hypothetical protein